MGYIFLFLVGFGFSIIGGITLIAYMNFLPAGISWIDYFSYVQERIECYLFPLGLLLMIFSLHQYPSKITNKKQ